MSFERSKNTNYLRFLWPSTLTQKQHDELKVWNDTNPCGGKGKTNPTKKGNQGGEADANPNKPNKRSLECIVASAVKVQTKAGQGREDADSQLAETLVGVVSPMLAAASTITPQK